jgi:SHS2 domain-containing protein
MKKKVTKTVRSKASQTRKPRKSRKSLKKTDPGWELLDHTADIRLAVHGATLEELFLNAWRGLTHLLAADAKVNADSEMIVSLDAETTEELLVDWLRELLFQNQTRKFVAVDVEIKELSGSCLHAKLRGGNPPSDFEPALEIKGVTYHGLFVEKTEEGYLAKIVLDI